MHSAGFGLLLSDQFETIVVILFWFSVGIHVAFIVLVILLVLFLGRDDEIARRLRVGWLFGADVCLVLSPLGLELNLLLEHRALDILSSRGLPGLVRFRDIVTYVIPLLLVILAELGVVTSEFNRRVR